MRLIELHMLQSFPVTCLNRDDVGAPKTAYFGGCQRARVSSQCWKRAIRLLAKDLTKEHNLFGGVRTRLVADRFKEALTRRGLGEGEAHEVAESVCKRFLEGKKKSEEQEEEQQNAKKKRGKKKRSDQDEATAETSTLLYFTPSEIELMAEAIASLPAEQRRDAEKLVKTAAEAAPQAHLKDGADIAIFGRMVANEPSFTLEGAGLFSHALSTHCVANEIDFWTAVDDDKPQEEPGAANMGDLEFNSACYYRYVGLNLDLLARQDHLGALDTENRQAVVRAFLKAAVLAVPPARKNSMFGFNPPVFVLGLGRQGQPLSLVNAFERPVTGMNGYITPSKEKLMNWWRQLKSTYGLQPKIEIILSLDQETEKGDEHPESIRRIANLDDFIEALVKDVP